ncbi:diguanylate cyclase [Colwellia sp. E2M01]|uniref:sensor domain-containing diguanylate cyclase n=1 Tax=Colwellia sp. E2M01 TaxID=2841561 RepID=UPI001C08F104|nr:diguanylate cyclase [Colwellia sp. E2M01]MBU2870854.1 diguanylate cyclase [Colwellia sp. E2M01]
MLFNTDAYAAEDNPSKKLILNNWYYHDGELPDVDSQLLATKNIQQLKVNETPLITQSSISATWQAAHLPILGASEHSQNILWLKRDLPSGNWRDPYIFISSIDLTVQVFQNNKLIYQYGDFDAQGNSQFSGWPWHLIRLPDDYDQHPIFLRIYSNYPDIGLSGNVFIGDRYDLLSGVYERGFIGFLFILVVLLVGIISTVMGMIKKDNHVAMCTGFLSFNLALMMFAENELNQAVWYNPLCWRYIAAFSYFLVPAFLALLMITWFKKSTPKIAYGVLLVSLFFVIGVLFLSLFTSFNFINAYPYFDMLFIVLVLALFIGCLKNLKKVEIHGVIMTVGVLALFISLVLDMMSAHRFIDWLGRSSQWGLILFTLTSLVIYLVRDWQQQIALTKFAQELEDKVEQRTQELKASQKQLQQVASEDFLTSLLNRRAFSSLATKEIANAIRHQQPISLLLYDIDHFKDINDQYGHSVGDLVLKAIANTSKNVCRNSELVCRYGGEEFVILLHSTHVDKAVVLAERLREVINAIEVKNNEDIIKITASFGLVTINDFTINVDESAESLLDSLLSKADELMYQAKVSGRDNVKAERIG